MVKGFLKKPDDNFLWRKYGNKLPEIVERSIIRYENIISKFKLAVRVLENSGKFKPQNKWQGKRKKEARTHSQD